MDPKGGSNGVCCVGEIQLNLVCPLLGRNF